VRKISFASAILEAQEHLLAHDPSVFVIGLGVPTSAGVFGTTVGLVEKFGPDRVLDMPASENGMTGMGVGAAIAGMRPIMVHNRVDFAVLAMEPIVNQAAKWFYTYGGQVSCPLTVRLIIGRGWGQGPQHSQSLQAWFAHVPGLKVVMPTTPSDAKQLLIAAVNDPAPVIVLEHRWLYDTVGPVAAQSTGEQLGESRLMAEGTDVTLVSCSYMTLECIEAARLLATIGVSASVVDLRTVSPLDMTTILGSVEHTRRLVVADTGHTWFGISGEILARVAEAGINLLSRPLRYGLPNAPTPTTAALSDVYYPRAIDIARGVSREIMGPNAPLIEDPDLGKPLDWPQRAFTGPY
jgi:pyruvate dehydrogenase E1 component beta subunit